MNTPVRLGVPPTARIPTGFTARGFESLVSCAENLGFMVCLTPPLFLLAYLHANVGLPSLPAASLLDQSATLPRVLSALAAHLRPSYQFG